MECVVCFSADGYCYTCPENKCHVQVCGECLSEYFQECLSEQLAPKCIGVECQEWYLSSTLPPETRSIYGEVLLAFYLKQDGRKVEQILHTSKLIEKLRERRQAFLNKHFTAPINLVVKLAFSKRLRKINNNQQKKVQSLSQTGKGCMNLFCNGILDSKFKCGDCDTSWCRQCEQRLTSGHKCRLEDLNSLKVMRNEMVECHKCKKMVSASNGKLPQQCPSCQEKLILSVECPKCNTFIFRWTGCNAMTCAVCQTSFNYNTRKITSHGSINSEVKLIEHQKLSGIHRERLSGEMLALILSFEAKAVKKKKDTAILNLLKKIKTNEISSQKGQAELRRLVELYRRNQSRYRRYLQASSQIEAEIIKNEPNLEKIKQIIAWV